MRNRIEICHVCFVVAIFTALFVLLFPLWVKRDIPTKIQQIEKAKEKEVIGNTFCKVLLLGSEFEIIHEEVVKANLILENEGVLTILSDDDKFARIVWAGSYRVQRN